MDRFAKLFVKASLVWLGLGVALGVAMAVRPAWTIYRPAHEHMNLVGFVTMMIFGVGYHVLPRIVGHPLISSRLPLWNWWASNVGLAGMVTGFALRAHVTTTLLGTWILSIGGLLEAIGAYLFIYNIWRTLEAARPTVPIVAAEPVVDMVAIRRAKTTNPR